MARKEILLRKPSKLAEQLEATVIIEGLLFLLSAFTANHEHSQAFCNAAPCSRLGTDWHVNNRCTCMCHRAREFLAEHRKTEAAA